MVFLLPWQGQTIAGTTDTPTTVTHFPEARESEVQFILDTIADYVDLKVRREDVSAAWSGIRPLVVGNTGARDTASMSRDHHIEVTKEGLITIVGKKMAKIPQCFVWKLDFFGYAEKIKFPDKTLRNF